MHSSLRVAGLPTPDDTSLHYPSQSYQADILTVDCVRCYTNCMNKQECIPVGCLPPAAVAVCPAIHTPPATHSPRHAYHPHPTRPYPATHAPRVPRGQIDTCENITLPQLCCGQ